MAVNRVDFGGKTLIDLSWDTLASAEQLLKGIIAHAKDGSVITGLMEAGGGGEFDFSGLPHNISLAYTGTYTPSIDDRLIQFGDFPGMKYPRIIILYPERRIQDTRYVDVLFGIYMSDEPMTEYDTGFVGAACIYGSSCLFKFNTNHCLLDDRSVYSMFQYIKSVNRVMAKAPQTSTNSSSAKYFKAGETYRYLFIADKE